MDAIPRGDARQWGCPGKDLYFTPRNGGECWRCRAGYVRTVKKIFEEKACNKKGLGGDYRDATFVRTAYGCPEGQFKRSGTCYECPAGSTPVSMAGVNIRATCRAR